MIINWFCLLYSFSLPINRKFLFYKHLFKINWKKLQWSEYFSVLSQQQSNCHYVDNDNWDVLNVRIIFSVSWKKKYIFESDLVWRMQLIWVGFTFVYQKSLKQTLNPVCEYKITYWICVLVLWIHKGCNVVKKLVWNVRIKALNTISYLFSYF